MKLTVDELCSDRVHFDDDAIGMHNSFLQVWVWWGIPAFLALCLFFWMQFRCLPGKSKNDLLVICLRGLFVAMLLRLFFTHNFFLKDFVVVVALLAAGKSWLWPKTAGHPFMAHARASG